MVTPRGAAAPEVYTPARIVTRYGLGPALIPDFVALKGDSADNIAAVPGIGEKTAAQLLIRYGSLEGVIAHAKDLTPARRKAIETHADSARAARDLATPKRDLPLPAEAAPLALVTGRPDRSMMKAVFEKYELKRRSHRRRDRVGSSRWGGEGCPDRDRDGDRGRRLALGVRDGSPMEIKGPGDREGPNQYKKYADAKPGGQCTVTSPETCGAEGLTPGGRCAAA